MSSSVSRKRKHVPKYRPQPSHEPDTALFIQAHEADVLSGFQALQSARSLEVEVLPSGATHIGDALIRWNASGSEEVSEEGTVKSNEEQGVWVDRYDARLLLDTLPSFSDPVNSHSPHSLSPTGWSDLPSDSEDTFFLTPDEIDDYHRDRRRKLLGNLREERIRALREDASEEDNPVDNAWGGSDEEPDEKQTELMRRTATHLFSSPNPAQLEMRILANHGADARFAFLKGRWSRRWRIIKARAKADEEAKVTKAGAGALGGLAGYGDSDEDSDNDAIESADRAERGNRKHSDGTAQQSTPNVDGDIVKAARRARAKEWLEKRRSGNVD